MLVEVAAGIAYRAVRNRGTIGGSLAHADPGGDWPLALAALDAGVILRGPAGERTIPAARLITAAFTTEIPRMRSSPRSLVPKLSRGARFGYFKFCRKTGEFPEASAAVVIDPERDATHVIAGRRSSGPAQPLPERARRIAEGDRLDGPSREAAIEAVATVHGLDPLERRMHAGALFRAVQQGMNAPGPRSRSRQRASRLGGGRASAAPRGFPARAICASPERISDASTASAGPARFWSPASPSARASPMPLPATGSRSAPSRASRRTRSRSSSATPSPATTRCSADFAPREC